MEQQDIKQFTDEALTAELIVQKKNNTFNAFAIGMLVGIALYSIVRNGFGFLPVILFFAVVVIHKKSARYRAVKEEIERRKNSYKS